MAPTARAGTVCGNVRDALSSLPVDRAGVFLFEPGGTYTGLYAATDPTGTFCVGSVPPGTYDLQVRVDDYLAAVLYGIIVEDDLTGIGIDARPLPPLRLSPPWPNPATDRAFLRFGFEEGGTFELVVFDLSGRLVRGWTASESNSGERTVSWDFTDRDGARVAPGIYFVRVTNGREAVTRRIAFLP